MPSTEAPPPAAGGPPPAVRLVGVTKRFGPVVANRDVNLTVAARTVHAIVGENGAGKSTLMKTLAGVHRADAGEVWIAGERITRPGPNEAVRRGLGMVHQHFMLVDPLTVAENLVLGAEPTRRGMLDVAAAARAVEELGVAYGLPVDPRRPVEELSVGERQRVEILKVLYRGVQILVLDEPTAVLTPGEVDGLFAMLRTFVDQGRTVILITHKLDEVMDLSQRVTVIRRGESVAEVDTAATSPRELAHLMVGREVALPGARIAGDDQGTRSTATATGTVTAHGSRSTAHGSRSTATATAHGSRSTATDPDSDQAPSVPLLAIEHLTLAGPGRPALDDVSLAVRAGEIVGIAGVQGNGQTELLECVAGLRAADRGSIRLGAAELTGLSPRGRIAAGLAHIPEDRHLRGLVLDLDLSENLILGRQRTFTRWSGLDRVRIGARARALIERFDVRPPLPGIAARALSGGNQQKVVVAREIADGPRVLLAGQPTRGVDIGAIESIHAELREARAAGLGVLLVSADLNELLALADRIAVIHRGRVVAEVPAVGATAARLGELMLGAGGAGDEGAADGEVAR